MLLLNGCIFLLAIDTRRDDSLPVDIAGEGKETPGYSELSMARFG